MYSQAQSLDDIAVALSGIRSELRRIADGLEAAHTKDKGLTAPRCFKCGFIVDLRYGHNYLDERGYAHGPCMGDRGPTPGISGPGRSIEQPQ